jgi:YggT family protein
MGAAVATFGLLLDWISRVQTFVRVFIIVYSLLIFAYVITSWIRLPYSLNKFQRFLYDVCEPYLRILRRVLPPLGPLDLSPMIAIGGLVLLEWIVNSVILDRLH